MEDAIKEGIVEGIIELIGGYPAIVARVLIIKVTWDRAVIMGITGANILINKARIPRFNNATRFRAVLVVKVLLVVL